MGERLDAVSCAGADDGQSTGRRDGCLGGDRVVKSAQRVVARTLKLSLRGESERVARNKLSLEGVSRPNDLWDWIGGDEAKGRLSVVQPRSCGPRDVVGCLITRAPRS